MGGRVGRKRKPGRRTSGDRLSRAGSILPFDRGTEHTQAMQSLYGHDGCDAIGRAYRAGLLGEGSEAKALLDLSRGISHAYWAAYANGSYRCPLDASPRGGAVVELDSEKARRREAWLNQCLATAKAMGERARKAFYQLCIDVNPDSGPVWLDRLVWARRQKLDTPYADLATLRAALDALEALC